LQNNSNMLDVITIGSATRDVFLVSDKFIALKSPKFETGVGECLNLGAKIELDDLVLTTGGGATNAAITFASLGFSTATICPVGDDAPGRDIKETLKIAGVQTKFMKIHDSGKTGYSTILTMKTGERTVLVHRGVSATFSSKDIPWKKLKAKWIYLTSLGGNITLAKEIILHAQKNKIKIAWNPGSKELEIGLAVFQKILPFVDVFNLNKEEAELLTRTKKIKNMLKLLQREEKITVITDGTKGAYAQIDGMIIHVGTRPVKVISQTGAGDAFGSGLVASLLHGENIQTALAIGVLNAESVIQSYGAKNGILTKWPSKQQIQKIPKK